MEMEPLYQPRRALRKTRGHLATVGQHLSSYAFDLWAGHWRKHYAKGQVIVVRYADDIVMGFQHEREAKRFMEDMRPG